MATKIIETIDQFVEAVPTAVGYNHFDDLRTYSHSAERWLVNKVLGTNLYNTILAMIDDSTSTGQDDTLITLCRNVIANHAYWDAVPFLDLQHTEAGFGVIQSTNKAPASKERVERLRAQCLARRDQELDFLIDYLMANTTYHDDWKGSTEFDRLFNSLLPTLTIYRTYHHIADRDTLDKMHSSIITAQSTTVAKVISSDYMDALIEDQKDDDFSTADLAILNNLRHAICLLSLSDSIHDMSVSVDTNGMVRSNNPYATNYANEQRLQSYASHFKARGVELLDKVLNTLMATPDDYPVFKASKTYEALIATGFENETDNEIFSSIF